MSGRPHVVRFVEQKLGVAEALNAGQCGGSYAEAAILISSAISGVAALLWPGERHDKRRFVEAWTRLTEPGLRADRVNLPLLCRELRTRGSHPFANVLEELRGGAFGAGQDSRVLTAHDVDMTEHEVFDACPDLGLVQIRRFSYPSIFYSQVRSALVHEYRVGRGADGYAMTTRDADVSYANELINGEVVRKIHFHPEWLVAVARSIAAGASNLSAAAALKAPSRWWLEGG